MWKWWFQRMVWPGFTKYSLPWVSACSIAFIISGYLFGWIVTPLEELWLDWLLWTALIAIIGAVFGVGLVPIWVLIAAIIVDKMEDK